MVPPPQLTRQKSSVEEVSHALHDLNVTMKRLSSEDANLKKELHDAKKHRRGAHRGSVAWGNVKNLPMKEIMRLQGEGPQEPVVEEYHSRATDVPSPSKATAKKTMRQIAEEAKTAELEALAAEKERLLAQRQKSARHSRDHSARHSSGGGHGNKHDFLTAWDNAYEEDALRFEIEQKEKEREREHAKREAELALYASQSHRRASDGESVSHVPLSGMDLALSKLEKLDKALDATRHKRPSLTKEEKDAQALAESSRPRRRGAPRRGAAAMVQQQAMLEKATRSFAGPDWSERTLPVLEAALESLSSHDGFDEASLPQHSLAQLSPSAAFLAVRSLITARREDDPPLPRGPYESVQQAALRTQVQANTLALILPKNKVESDEHFKLRLACFKPRSIRGSKKTKPPLATFVIPMAEDERAKDFEVRMKMQEVTPFVILPRDNKESLHDYNERIDAIGEARTLWLEHEGGIPPLLLPRGGEESEEVFKERLNYASTPPEYSKAADAFCPVYLPQGAGEDERMAVKRFEMQAKSKGALLPYDEKLETPEEFYARIKMSRKVGSI